ncbi:Inner membrane protein YgaP [Arthrobacter sp. SO3]|nr:Inner membrane protein YgaP [Arthrobacter sp. SO3]
MFQDIPKEIMTSLKRTPVESAPQSIDASTLKAWEDNHDDLMIIDVRGGAEFDSLHIKGSYHVPLPMLSEHTEEFAAKMGTRVVLVCQSGNRAEQARKHLDAVGLAGASVLAGGVPAYAAAGGTVVRGRGPWALERQVRMTAGSLVLASIVAAKFVSPKLGLVAGGIGAGLTFSAATNSCAMGQVLSKMPWNRSANEPTAHQALQNLDARA